MANECYYVEATGELVISIWFHHGGVATRRDALDSNHPESEYQKIKGLGLRPEDFGVVYHGRPCMACGR